MVIAVRHVTPLSVALLNHLGRDRSLTQVKSFASNLFSAPGLPDLCAPAHTKPHRIGGARALRQIKAGGSWARHELS
jgi:hypothetical protein